LDCAVVLLGIAAFVTFVPLWVPLVMAAWTAILAYPLQQRAARKLGGSHRAASVLTVGFVLLAVIPLTLLGVSLATEGIAQVRRIADSPDATKALLSVVSGGAAAPGGPAAPTLPSAGNLSVGSEQVMNFMRQHGSSTWRTLSTIAGATATALIGVFVFVLGIYAFLVDGKRTYAWLADHAPLSRPHFHRFANAFAETGRGLFIGVGLTAVGQGALATIAYVVLGLPQAAVLGALTTLAAFIPSAGAALVWAPVTAGLALSGRPAAAVAMLVMGLVISIADNFVRPWLSRHGQLRLPTFVLLISMLGGITMFGTWGLVLGPLLVRLTVEGLNILREQRLLGQNTPAANSG
ncbi:MAG TPA: AI-2E family transporter, partial [Polyangiaceae bacterium]|nr:AI-2E family transporter [Polyangiaceae bacterium]